MLPPPTLTVADRLITTLMTFVDAIFPIALTGSTPTFPDHAAHILFLRLSHLVTTLIRISNFGIRAPASPAAPKIRTQPAPTAERPGPTQTLPRHRGWLLAALPDIAPAIAADLRALLDDPALTALFAAAPTLHRALRPLLRGLDLAAPQPPPSPRTPPPRLPSPARPPAAQPGPAATPSPQPPDVPSSRARIHSSPPTSPHVRFVTI